MSVNCEVWDGGRCVGALTQPQAGGDGVYGTSCAPFPHVSHHVFLATLVLWCCCVLHMMWCAAAALPALWDVWVFVLCVCPRVLCVWDVFVCVGVPMGELRVMDDHDACTSHLASLCHERYPLVCVSLPSQR